jgi:hypothetical protein
MDAQRWIRRRVPATVVGMAILAGGCSATDASRRRADDDAEYVSSTTQALSSVAGRRINVNGRATNAAGGFLFVVGHLNTQTPPSPTVFITGYSAGFVNFYNCDGQGVTFETLEASPNASTGTVKFSSIVNKDTLQCSGTPPANIVFTCVANGDEFDTGVLNSTTRTPKEVLKFHSNVNTATADCTGTADAETFDISLGGSITYAQSVGE